MASPSRYLLSKLDCSSTQAIYVQVPLVHRYSPKEDMGIERPPKGSGKRSGIRAPYHENRAEHIKPMKKVIHQ